MDYFVKLPEIKKQLGRKLPGTAEAVVSGRLVEHSLDKGPRKMSSSQKEIIYEDWKNREYIEIITGSIKKIADFLNSFGEWAGGLWC